MIRTPLSFTAASIAVLTAVTTLTACSKPAEPAPAPAPAAAQAAPAPAKPMKMVCRNSQDGRKVACGTPGAVMVGMTPE